MLLLISDSSVLIDIENGNLTNAMFSLPWQFAVPDTLFSEELAERHSHLLHIGLISKTLNKVCFARSIVAGSLEARFYYDLAVILHESGGSSQ